MPDAIHNTNQGNVGIGTDLPGEKLDVAGNLRVRGTVGIGTQEPNASAALEINSTTGALLLPRMTTEERNSLNATEGMIIYNSTDLKYQGYSNNIVNSDPVVDQSQLAIDNGFGPEDKSQSFTAGLSGALTSVRVLLNCPMGPQTATIYIREGAGNSGAILYQSAATINYNDGGNWVTINPSGVNLIAGNVYSINIVNQGGFGPDSMIDWLCRIDVDNYSGGNLFIGGEPFGGDGVFETTVTPSPTGSLGWININPSTTTDTTDLQSQITTIQSNITSIQSNFVTTIDDPSAIYNVNQGNVGIGTDLPGEKLDVAGNLKVRGTVNNMNVGNLGSGSGNVAFGNSAYNNNASSDDNTAIGNGAMQNATTGSNNVAVGAYALNVNTTGFWNNAIGYGSLGVNTTGYQNIGLGFGTLGTNTTGYQNTAIGNSSNVAAGDLNNATAIGNGALVDASNKIQLGNTDVTSVNTSGSYTGAGFVKAGGTSSQFLMADGSVSDGILATITAMQAQITALQNQISGLIQLSTLSTVVIGTQKWTTKNLNVTTYSNGDIIPEVQDGEAWANLTTGAWCHLNNDPANDAIYGKMYNHYAVEDPRGLAPTGYHIPTQAEWFTLFETAGGWYSCSPKLRSTVFNGTDDYGFSVLNGGSRSGNAQEMWFPGEPMIPAGTFQTSTAMFWSSDVLPQYTGAYFGDWNATGTSDFPNNYGAYIRLIKN